MLAVLGSLCVKESNLYHDTISSVICIFAHEFMSNQVKKAAPWCLPIAMKMYQLHVTCIG